MWRIVTFSFEGKGTYEGTFAIEVDNSGVPVQTGGNLNFTSISGDAVETCTYGGGVVTIVNEKVPGAGKFSNFPSSVEGQTYTEQEPAGTWSYTNATSSTVWRQITFSFSGKESTTSGTFVIEVSAFTGVPTSTGIYYNFASVSGDEVTGVDYTDSKDLLQFNTVNGPGACSSFSTAVASQTYTELDPAGTWSYVITTPTLYSITASSGNNCTISPEGTVSVIAGGSKTFEMLPAQGYQISSVLVDGTDVGAVSTYTFSNVQADHTISASATALPTYNITSTAGVGGIILPSGTTTVYEGGSQAYSITPSTGFDINDVLVDSTSVGTVSSYTFSNVQADHTISASFNPVQVIKTYRVITFNFESKSGTYSGVFQIAVNPDGIPYTTDFESISGEEVRSVAYNPINNRLNIDSGLGEQAIFSNFPTAVPNQTYTESAPGGTWSYTLGSTTTTYTIVPSAGANGEISPNDPVIVNEGSSQAFTITPSEGYKVASVLVDGTEAKQDLVNNVYTFTNVSAVHTIAASFEELPTYDITIQTNCGTGDIGKKNWDEIIVKLHENLPIVTDSYDRTTQIGTITINSTSVLPTQFSETGSYIVSVVLPDCFTEIEDAAFAGCSNMVSITLPDTMQVIGADAFSECTSLTSLELPASVIEVGEGFLDACDSLEEVICLAPVPPTTGSTISTLTLPELRVPSNSINLYLGSPVWSSAFNVISPIKPSPKRSGFNISGMIDTDYIIEVYKRR